MKVDIALTENRELKPHEISLDAERYAAGEGSTDDRTEFEVGCNPNNPLLDVVSSYFKIGLLSQTSDLYDYPGIYEIIFHTKNYRQESEFVLELCDFDENTGNRALLVGCGPGNHSVHLSEAGLTVHGVDPSEKMLVEARKKSDGTFHKGKLPEIDLRSTFDLVWCPFSVLNLVAPDNLDAGLRHLRELVGDEGYLIVDCAKFSPMNWPNIQLVSKETTGCLLLYKYEKKSENAVQWETVVWYEDMLLTDSQTLYNHSYEEIRSQLGQSGTITEINGWYGLATPLAEPRIFVLHDP